MRQKADELRSAALSEQAQTHKQSLDSLHNYIQVSCYSVCPFISQHCNSDLYTHSPLSLFQVKDEEVKRLKEALEQHEEKMRRQAEELRRQTQEKVSSLLFCFTMTLKTDLSLKLTLALTLTWFSAIQIHVFTKEPVHFLSSELTDSKGCEARGKEVGGTAREGSERAAWDSGAANRGGSEERESRSRKREKEHTGLTE